MAKGELHHQMKINDRHQEYAGLILSKVFFCINYT